MAKKTRIRAEKKKVTPVEEERQDLSSVFASSEEPKVEEPIKPVEVAPRPVEESVKPVGESKPVEAKLEEPKAEEKKPQRAKVRFSRASFVFVSLVFFYCLFCVFVGICINPETTMVVADNPIAAIRDAFAFPLIGVSVPTYVTLAMMLVYTFLFLGGVTFEERLAKYYSGKALSGKMFAIYIATFVVCYGLAFGISALCHYPFDQSNFAASLIFVGEAMFIGLIIFLVFAAALFFLVVLIVNIKNWSKPFDEKATSEAEEEAKKEEALEEAFNIEQGSLANRFGQGGDFSGGAGGVPNEGDYDKSRSLGDVKDVFPGLYKIDYDQKIVDTKMYDDSLSLSEICVTFRDYLASKEKLYFDISTIRSFIAGLSASRLIILEGLSGTGKSSIARYFGEFIGEPSFFAPVQATWRDRTSLLGFYNDFSHSYSETEFLKCLYAATYSSQAINVMVLDEMNISRIEYYFADFLSIMEYPMDHWILPIMQFPSDFEGPAHMEDGKLAISKTTWFIGTANKDDSTYTITDKVYDRAIVLSFDDKNVPFVPDEEGKQISLSYAGLVSLFDKAKEEKSSRLSNQDIETFEKLSSKVRDAFGITYGNRIYNQIENFVPVYVSCGGNKVDALDFMFARKILRKLEGRFEDYVKDELEDLLKDIDKLYGADSFKQSKALIHSYLRRFMA